MPVHDLVYVNAANGKIALKAPKIHTALNRKVYSANNGTSTPGTLKRSEGGAATGDNHVDVNYAKLGGTYNCYFTNFGRDSYDAAGHQLISTVHYSTNYVNAYWDGTQMVYGDGDGVNSTQLGLSADVTTHELTHAVTENESNLTYSGESGGINEAMSDIFGAYCQSWEAGGWPTTNSVFMVGDDIWTPATPNDALRYMYDPKADGSSLDYWTSSAGSVDVHYSSGIANLAFTLLSKGGTHPRGKSTVVVPAIGVEKAGKIYYYANRDYLTASSNYAALKTALENAAGAAYPGDATVLDAVTKSMNAVGVGVVTPPPPTVTLSNGVPVTGIGDSAGGQKFYKLTVPASQTSLVFATTGGTGDVDLYTKQGSAPTTSTYTCRPYASGNAETCTHSSPAAGDWYVMLNAYSTYSGVTLTGTYTGGGGTGTPKTDTKTGSVASGSMVQVSNYSGLVAGSTFKVTMTGTGDPDLYVRWGAAPTTTTYTCRPYVSGASETCTITVPSGTTSAYVAVRGYTAATYSLSINYTSTP
jgi:vibriolysin